MSGLRIAGIVIGLVGLIFTFMIHRGPKWNKFNFVFLSLFNIFLLSISINPNLGNFARDVFALKESERGRLLGLLIFSNIFLVFYSFFTRTRLENLRVQFDKLIRNQGIYDISQNHDIESFVKPIMIIIPAYNESDNLKKLLPRIPERVGGMEVGVFVIDDGSDDDTVEVVRRHGYLAVSNRINRGQGAASRTGYDLLKKYKVEIGVTIDGDNQHRPEDLEQMLAPILNGQADMVIGSRIIGEHQKVNWIRNLGILLFSKLVSLLMNHRISDCSSGFKAFSIEKLKKLNLTEDQFQSTEVLIEAGKKGLRIKEAPITINHRLHGKSKKGKDLSYGFNFSKTILKTWWR